MSDEIVRFADQDLWLTQEQLAEIYDTTQQNISSHLLNIYADGELDKDATHKKFLLVRHEGSRDVNRQSSGGHGEGRARI